MITKKDPNRQEVKIEFEYNAEKDFNKDAIIETKYILLNEPNWSEFCESYKYMVDSDGKDDFISSGRVLFDLCCFECDPIVEKNHQLMASICTQLSILFLYPTYTDLKKK